MFYKILIRICGIIDSCLKSKPLLYFKTDSYQTKGAVMTKQIPVGISDFKEIIERNYYYVDKTLLIKDIVESGKVILITRPRRFGKSLNLSMLRYFYEQNEQSTAHLFDNLAVWQHPSLRELQGAYPVIFVTFKDLLSSSYEVMINQFAYAISQEFNRHEYLLSSSALNESEKKRFKRILNEEGSQVDLGTSLQFLLRVLAKHHKRNVVIIIDEYDVPVQNAYLYGFYEKLILFIKELLTSVLKDNPILEKAVITGIYTLAKAGIYTGLNNLDVYNLTDEKMADKFGFTLQEATAMFEYYNIQNPDEVKAWYNGYVFGKSHGIFNPWSMVKCVDKKGALILYWANTSDNALLKKMIMNATVNIKTDLELLLTDQTVEKLIDESILFADIDREPELIWTILLFTGYVTYTQYVLKGGKKVCSLAIPNQEIKYLYKDLIGKLFGQMVGSGKTVEFLRALTEGNTELFANHLRDFILNSMSSHDISSAEPEKSYHLFVLGILVMLGDEYIVKSNQESGLGRYDLMIIPKQKHRKGIVIELKKVSSDKSDALELAAQKAIEQILETKYAQAFYEQDIHDIICYGIAFAGKQVCVKSIELSKS